MKSVLILAGMFVKVLMIPFLTFISLMYNALFVVEFRKLKVFLCFFINDIYFLCFVKMVIKIFC